MKTELKSKSATALGPLGALFVVLIMASQPTYAILNGDPVNQGDYPYFVGVGRYENDEFSNCGGVLIHPEWVLTANHCVKPNHIDRSIPIGLFHALDTDTGTWKKQSNVTPKPGIKGQVKWTESGFDKVDLALIKLAEPVWGAENRLELATAQPAKGTLVKIIGGGYYKKGNAARDRVRSTLTRTQHEPSQQFGKAGAEIFGIQTGGCLHDSGGPLVYNNKVLGIQTHESVCEGSSESSYALVTKPSINNWIHCTVPLDPKRTTVVQGRIDLEALGASHKVSSSTRVKIFLGGNRRFCETGIDENGFYRAYLPSDINTGSYTVSVRGKSIRANNNLHLKRGMINTIQTQTSPNEDLKIIGTSSGHINNYGGQDPYKNWMPELGEVIQAERWDEGDEGIAFYDRTKKRWEAGNHSYRPDSPVDSTDSVVSHFSPTEWLEYTVSIPDNLQGVSGKMRMRAAAGCAHGKSMTVLIESNASSAPLRMNVPYTGSWSQYQTVDSTSTVSFTGDTAVIRVKHNTLGSGCAGINLDWFQFVPSR